MIPTPNTTTRVIPITDMPADVAERASLMGRTHRADEVREDGYIVSSSWGTSEDDALANLAKTKARVAELRREAAARKHCGGGSCFLGTFTPCACSCAVCGGAK